MRLVQKRKRIGRSALLATTALVLSGLYVAPASASATCTQPTGSSGVGEVIVTGADTTFTMSNGQLVVAPGTGCTFDLDTSTATGADVIEVTSVPASLTNETITFDLSGGQFVTVDGVEVWFKLDLGGQTAGNDGVDSVPNTPDDVAEGQDTVIVNATDDKDRVTLGTEGINLDGKGDVEVTELEDADPGNDLDMSESGVDAVTVNGRDSNDVIFADGSLSGDEFPCTGNVPVAPGVDYCPSLTINGDGGNDILLGGNGDDVINGGAGNDTLETGAGDDTANGDAGKDKFDADRTDDGSDKLDGGPDKDTIDYSDRTNPVSVSLGTAFTAGDDGEALEADDVINMEVVFGGEADDIINASASTAKMTLFGFDGVDTLTGGTANDTLRGGKDGDTLNGGDGNDKLDGQEGDDTENGDGGNDKFLQSKSGNGNDVMDGGADTDVVKYNGRSSKVTIDLTTAGGEGETGENDTITNMEKVVGGRADDEIKGYANDANILLGGSGDDKLTGGSGDDVLKGGSGDDELLGLAGEDKLVGGSGKDFLDGGTGTDTLNGGTGRDRCRNGEKLKSCP